MKLHRALREALVANGITLKREGDEIKLYIDGTMVAAYAAEQTNVETIYQDLLGMGVDAAPETIQRLLTGQLTERKFFYTGETRMGQRTNASGRHRAVNEALDFQAALDAIKPEDVAEYGYESGDEVIADAEGTQALKNAAKDYAAVMDGQVLVHVGSGIGYWIDKGKVWEGGGDLGQTAIPISDARLAAAMVIGNTDSGFSHTPSGDARQYKSLSGGATQESKTMKVRALRESAAKKLVARRPSLKIYREDELDGLPSDEYYILVVPDASDEVEVSFHDGELCVGPFDTPEDAAHAVGDMDGDVNVVDAEGNPVSADLEDDGLGGEPVVPMEGKRSRRTATRQESRRTSFAKLDVKSLHEQVRREIQEAADELDIDTTIGHNKDGSTDGASGNYSGNGAPPASQQTAQDAGTTSRLDVDADRFPEKKDAIPGAEVLNDPAKGGMDSNDQDLSGAGDGKGGVHLESVASNGISFKRGNMATVYENGRRIDSGLIESVSKDGLTLEGGEFYQFAKFEIRKVR